MFFDIGSREQSRRYRVEFIVGLALLALVVCLHEATNLDFLLQDLLYQRESHSWIIAKSWRLPRFLFYHGPKLLLIAFGVWILISLLLPRTFRGRPWLSSRPAGELIYILLCLAAFPALIGGLKKTTGLHCPSELARYEGKHDFHRLFAAHLENFGEKGHCFPAGHASGGFALLALYRASKTPRTKKLTLALALAAGWLMGLYQMLVGAHFLSHTLATMILAWLFTLLPLGLVHSAGARATLNPSV